MALSGYHIVFVDKPCRHFQHNWQWHFRLSPESWLISRGDQWVGRECNTNLCDRVFKSEHRTCPGVRCPDCEAPMAHRSGCVECPACGYSVCAN